MYLKVDESEENNRYRHHKSWRKNPASKYVDFKSVLSFSSGSEFFWLWLIRVFEILHNYPLPTNAVTKTVETLKVMNSYSPHPLLTT